MLPICVRQQLVFICLFRILSALSFFSFPTSTFQVQSVSKVVSRTERDHSVHTVRNYKGNLSIVWLVGKQPSVNSGPASGFSKTGLEINKKKQGKRKSIETLGELERIISAVESLPSRPNHRETRQLPVSVTETSVSKKKRGGEEGEIGIRTVIKLGRITLRTRSSTLTAPPK